MLNIQDAELPFLQRILAAPKNVDEKLVYSDWLQSQNDPRGQFLAEYIRALKSMAPDAFPKTGDFHPSWLELIGFNAMSELAKVEGAAEFRDQILDALEAAIRIDTEVLSDDAISSGATKYGGLPDLPNDFSWPLGRDCDAIYNNDTAEIDALAGFLMQLNLEEAQSSPFVDLPLPKSGLLSFFCYQDDDDVDCIGVNCFHFKETTSLQRTSPPAPLSNENELPATKRITLRECVRIQSDFETDNRTLADFVWQQNRQLGNQSLFGVRDYQTSNLHFIGIDKNDYTTVFVDVTPDIAKVDLSWVEFDGDTGFK